MDGGNFSYSQIVPFLGKHSQEEIPLLIEATAITTQQKMLMLKATKSLLNLN